MTARAGRRVEIVIDRTWDAAAARPDEVVRVAARRDADGLRLEIEAPFHDDPPPAAPPGPTPALWEHEVVEVFLLAPDERYLEVELGPHGHHLVLALRGRRRIEREQLAIGYHAIRSGGRWQGEAAVPAALLPRGADHWNAYAIHGTGSHRRYLAHAPVPGEQPDFHRLDAFVPLPAALRDDR